MTTASTGQHRTLPAPPAGPSAELAARAEDGLARFLERWEALQDNVRHDRADDTVEGR